MKIVAFAGLLTLTLLAVGPAAVGKTDEANFVERALEGLSLGPGQQSGELIVFPLVAAEIPAALAVTPDVACDDLAFSEPEFPRKRYDVTIENSGDKTALLFGGGILTGGKLDRLVPQSVLVPPKSRLDIHTLPAEYPRDKRRGESAGKFSLGTAGGHATAPAFLRERAIFDPARNLVPIFISHYLKFRDKDDRRRSLAAIDESSLLASYCDACQNELGSFEPLGTKKVVGVVTAVRGRVLTLELFGSNRLFRAYFNPINRAHTYAAAAIALRAKDLGMPVPGKDDAEKAKAAARKEAEELLEAIRSKARYRDGERPKGAIGETLLIRWASTDGTAIGLDGRLVHAVIFPENPFEEALYSRPLAVPPSGPEGGEGESLGELDRREDRGTLTEAEKRLLDRMRRRR